MKFKSPSRRRSSRNVGYAEYAGVAGVYCFKAVGSSFVKIGVATDIKKRWVSINAANPLGVLIVASLPGAYELEKKLHKKFGDRRVKGTEWFRDRTGSIQRWFKKEAKAPKQYDEC